MLDILIWLFFIILLLGIISVPSILTYFLYKYLKKKGRKYKIIGILIFLITPIVVILFINQSIGDAFGPTYDYEEIDQDIGGVLFCESEYLADHHSWEYNVQYKYLTEKGDTIDFGYGYFIGKDWMKNEQLFKLNNWLILVTGIRDGSDRLILKNIQTDSTIVYDFDSNFIEKNILWKRKKIKSLHNYCCDEISIEDITEKYILIKYKFRTDKDLVKEYETRMIKYKIDKKTGSLDMIEID